MTSPDPYAEDGVNRRWEDEFSSFAGAICASTDVNSPYIEVRRSGMGHFRGSRMFRFRNLPPDCWFDGGNDGIGTSPVLFVAGGAYRNAASHLIAMTFGDMTRHGRLPLMLFTNQFDVESIGVAESETRIACQEIFYGLAELADRHHFVIYKGETAQMGMCVGSSMPDAHLNFNWSGTVFAAAHPDREITGASLRPGHVLVALREYGFRGCGFSSVREALARGFGSGYWESANAQVAIRAATAPAVLYDTFLTTMNGWFEQHFQPLVRMHAIVHLSGGSLESKLAGDILFPLGLSADLTDLWPPPEIMRQCALWRGMTSTQAYRTWNGGQGMIVAVEDHVDASRLIAYAATFGIEARICGVVQDRLPRSLRITSKFNSGLVEYFPRS